MLAQNTWHSIWHTIWLSVILKSAKLAITMPAMISPSALCVDANSTMKATFPACYA